MELITLCNQHTTRKIHKHSEALFFFFKCLNKHAWPFRVLLSSISYKWFNCSESLCEFLICFKSKMIHFLNELNGNLSNWILLVWKAIQFNIIKVYLPIKICYTETIARGCVFVTQNMRNLNENHTICMKL